MLVLSAIALYFFVWVLPETAETQPFPIENFGNNKNVNN